ncbi:exopolyphosphatase/guanosine-5'-triphosphate,3'-diphosphate pyrophosphatase [Lebetimonas natsushimae]|uniref:Exopolyphosphatase/guanosine-5'-triphosphate,3'-diphosphate pyrophosphatase n=1 Tax=Lebetimonas natsushimae TaxID=1936991 RepID=A0A292YAY0_9BACT|nr:Ppx/GppA phosphatase family protein [Lebetimonas natsushimae]GAX86918.1 exopolyphosphatase/guanosine-5'-triphosphate,3'-diphosphate pyrophosphatase [Lebetimonas natsushimae]
MAKITAVIDIGSNSARMAVFKKTSRFGFYLLREEKSRVRISEGAYENGGNLQDFAIKRALYALKEFLLIAKSLKVRKILAVATSAVRDAPNKAEFLKEVRKIGINLKVIDGEKEAFFGGVAVANLLYKENGVSVDIGGGSCELSLIRNRKVEKTATLQLGTVRLKELFFDKKNIAGAKKYIKSELIKLDKNFKDNTVFGIGGTARALAQVIMKKNEYPLDILHGFTYSNKELEFLENLIYKNDEELLKVGIKPERLDVIRPGILTFVEVIKYLKAKEIVTSGVGVREGVFLSDLLRNDNLMFPKNFNPSVRTIIDVYNINRKTASYETKIVLNLFDLLKNDFKLDEKYKKHLTYAIKLSRAGELIDFYEAHKHTDYILLNALHYGFSHKDRLLISKIIRFHKRKKIKKREVEKFKNLLPKKEILEKLCNIFLVAKIVNQNLSMPEIKIKKEGKKIIIEGKNLYLASEKIKTKKLFFEINIINKG